MSSWRMLGLLQTFESVNGTPDEVVCGARSLLTHVTVVPTATVTFLCLKSSIPTVTGGIGVGEGVAVGGSGVGLGGNAVEVGGSGVELGGKGVDVGGSVAVAGAAVAEGRSATDVGGTAVKVGA